MMFTKDKKPVELISDHIDTVGQCIMTAARAVESHIEGNLSEATDLALQADALELDVNHKMEEITRRLCQGGGVAPVRENLYQLARGFNQVAEEATTCSLFFFDRRPAIPQSFRLPFIKLAATAFSGYPEIKKEALNCLKGSWRRVKGSELVLTFGPTREKVKSIRRDLYRRISEIDDAPWQQVTLDTCLIQITCVFDRMALAAETIIRSNLRLGI